MTTNAVLNFSALPALCRWVQTVLTTAALAAISVAVLPAQNTFTPGLVSASGVLNPSFALTAGAGNPPTVLVGSANNGSLVYLNGGQIAGRTVTGADGALTAMVAADFDQDGLVDVIAAFENGGHAFHSNGDGTFRDVNASFVGDLAGCQPMATGDFNGDGIPDLVMAGTPGGARCSQGAGTVFVELGDGAWHFTQVVNTWKRSPIAVAVMDFNRDGKLDLISTNSDSTLSIMIGDGTGHFKEIGTYFMSTSDGAYDLAVGDFNRDGNPDVAIAYRTAGTVVVMLGDGISKFKVNQARIPVGANPRSLVVADFNRDGNPDIALVNYLADTVTLLSGKGDGTHFDIETYPVYHRPKALAIADLDGDGGPDLLVVSSDDPDDGSVNLKPGMTTRLLSHAPISVNAQLLTFSARAGFAPPTAIPVAIRTLIDSPLIATADQAWLSATLIRDAVGKTTGVSVVADPSNLPARTYTGNIRIEAPGTTGQPVNVKVTFNVENPSGTLRSGFNIASKDVVAVAKADFNNDGRADLAVAGADGLVRILLGNGAGSFTEAAAPNNVNSADPIVSMVAADYDGDGNTDIIFLRFFTDLPNMPTQRTALVVWQGNGTGQFTPVTQLNNGSSSGCLFGSMAAGDFDGDGRLDLILQSNPIGVNGSSYTTLLTGDGLGRFTSPGQQACNTIKAPYGNANSIASGDFNRDGNLDFVVIGFSARTGRQGLSMYLGDGRGSFYEAAGSPYLTDSLMRSVTVGDVNGDGKLDLIVAHSVKGPLVWLGDGAGGFSLGPAIGFGVDTFSVALGDWNGDGYPDLAAASAGGVTVMVGNGAGGFLPVASFGGAINGAFPVVMASGDFNGDGRLDLAVPTGGVTLLTGDAAATTAVLTHSGSTSTVSVNQPISFQVTLSRSGAAFNEPSGTVTFYDRDTVLGTVTHTSGNTYTLDNISLSFGIHLVTAKYAGNARSIGATSNALQLGAK